MSDTAAHAQANSGGMAERALHQCTSASEFLRVWIQERQRLFRSRKALETFTKYYASYVARFPQRIQHYYDEQLREVVDLVQRIGQPKLLEVGCGTGTESLWLSLHGASVTGIDIRADRLAVADERLQVLREQSSTDLDCQFRDMSLLEFSDEPCFDIVWMEQAFHHLEPRNEVADKLARIIKPGGFIVVAEANGLNPFLQLALFRRRGWRTIMQLQDDQGHWHPYGNERVLSARRLFKVLQRAGFESVSHRHFRVFPNHPWFDRRLALEQSLPRWLLPVFTHYNYVGRKPE